MRLSIGRIERQEEFRNYKFTAARNNLNRGKATKQVVKNFHSISFKKFCFNFIFFNFFFTAVC